MISSDETGNIYKTISLQDSPENPTVGIQIEIDGGNLYNEYPLGARIQISLKGLVVAKDRGVMKIGSVDPNFAVGRIKVAEMKKYIFKTCDPVKQIQPKVVNSLAEALLPGNVNTLVTINNVQFKQPEVDLTYSVSGTTVNRVLIDKTGKETDLRNSGYAKWFDEALPTKSGSITVIVSMYNSSYQLFIRDTKDVNFTQDRFTVGGGGGNTGGGVEATNLLFPGSDFNDWNVFLSSLNSFQITDNLAVQGIGNGRDDTNSLHLNGTPEKNTFVFTVKADGATTPANAKKITMWVKGSAAKSLSFNLDTTTGRKFYNLGAFGAEDAVFSPQENNQYTGAVNTNGQWRLVTLNIEGLTLNTTGDLLGLKIGSATKYDILIDNIKID